MAKTAMRSVENNKHSAEISKGRWFPVALDVFVGVMNHDAEELPWVRILSIQ